MPTWITISSAKIAPTHIITVGYCLSTREYADR
jgi:hypothetical protein